MIWQPFWQPDDHRPATIDQLPWQRANNHLATHYLGMDRSFEIHQNPNRSRLEQWRNEISQMRSLNWPYHRIAKWLDDEHGLSFSKEAVRKFCRVRSIEKGMDQSLAAVPARRVQRNRVNSKENPFRFDDSDADKPIEIKRR